ncbi:hypothetical protein TELCIR_09481, partial [Teladorsagia circumcincta]
MSHSKSINSEHRAYGSFGPNSKAAALFDAAFSKPLPKKRWQAQKQTGDSPAVDSLPSGCALSTTTLRSSQSPQTGTARTSSTFDFEDNDDSPPPSVKRSKISPPPSSPTKITASKDRRPVYQHKWTEDDDEESESGTSDVSGDLRSTSNRQPIYSRANETAVVGRVKEAHQCLESGEHDDFKQDIEYILGTMKGKAPVNIKCLSALSLARKCISSEFRQFVRSEGLMSNVFKGLAEAANDQ